MRFNPDIHHRQSIRLKDYDYSKAGLYFITICTHNRLRIFGNIDNGRMALNECGQIAREEWQRTSEIRTNLYLDAFVVMPNHIHGIIQIHCGTMDRAPTVERFGKPTSNSIPTIVRGYKSAVTKRVKILKGQNDMPIWQRSYYEHIIRDEPSYRQITEYIQGNPLSWEDDRYYENSW